MIASLLRWIALAYGAPRQAARNLLSNQPSTGDALLMILAGTVLIAAAGVLAELIAGRSLAAAMLEGMQKLQAELDVPGAEAGVTAYAPPPLADKLVAVATAIAEGAVLTILTGAAAFGIGKLFRGKASLAECLAVTGLSSIVRAPAELLAMLALLLMPPESFAFGSSIGLGLALVLLYQFSAFVAEAHGFRSVGAVMGMTLGVSLTAMSIFMAMAAGPMTVGPT
jgi:hypothetical protein